MQAVYLVQLFPDPSTPRESAIVGVFSDERAAIAACEDRRFFYVSLVVDVPFEKDCEPMLTCMPNRREPDPEKLKKDLALMADIRANACPRCGGRKLDGAVCREVC